MIYVRDENVEFYDSLENKSDFINEALKLARLGGVQDLKVTEKAEEEQIGLPDIHDAVESMQERDERLLKEYRERNGIAPPARL